MRIKGSLSPQNNGTYTSFMRHSFLLNIFQGTRSSEACRGSPGLPTVMEGDEWSPYDGCWQQPAWRLVDTRYCVPHWCFQLASVRNNLTCTWRINGCKRVAKFIWPVALHVCNYLVRWLIFGMQTQWSLEFIRASISPLK